MERYTNKTMVSELLGGIDDSLIQDDWLDFATAQVDTMTMRTWGDYTVEERYDGFGMDELYLDNTPVISITKLEYLQDNTTDTWLEFNKTYTVLYKDEGRIKMAGDISGQETSCFHKGIQNWRVTYLYGAEEIPAIVRFLASLYVIKSYNISITGTSGDIASETIGAYSVSYGAQESVSVDDLITDLVKKLKINDEGVLGL